MVSLSSLSIFLVPLIAMLLAYDAIVGEADRGTLALLLSYPVARWQVMAGKFAGHLVILALATGAGYGFAGLALQWLHGGGLDAAAWRPFALLIGASVLLGASFLALGYLVSAAVRARHGGRHRGRRLAVLRGDLRHGAAGRAGGRPGPPHRGALNALLLLNPSDVYRLLNLTGFEHIAMYAGMAGVGDQASLPLPTLALALLLWIAAPLLLAAAVFRSRQL